MKTHAVTRRHFLGTAAGALAVATLGHGQTAAPAPFAPRARRTLLSIEGERFLINGQPTYAGRTYRGHRIEGLLLNSRMVQGTFDDLNPETATQWAYPDTGRWDAERNVREFLAGMPLWRAHGLLSFTLNLQGGSPQGYAQGRPWVNSAFEPDGSLRADYMARLERILDFADELGMVVILGYFYFGQNKLFTDEAAVARALDQTTRWLLERNYTHLLIEVGNETNDKGYKQKLLQRDGIAQAIRRVQQHTLAGRRLLAGTSYPGKVLPTDDVVAVSDFILLHGNGESDPQNIRKMVRKVRKNDAFKPKPILFNEDDHFDFDQPDNHFLAALSEGASWGFFDPGASNYVDGYQCPPINWGVNTPRKKAFFDLVREMSGATPPTSAQPDQT